MAQSISDRWVPAEIIGRLFKCYLCLPEHPFKVRVENWLGKILFRRGIRLRGHSSFLQLDANDWITRILIEEGNYENLSLSLAKQLLRAGGIFVDIGANFGLYTCILGKLPDVRCIAVEPSPEMFLQLKRNLELNPTVDAVRVHLALSSSSRLVKFNCPNSGNKGTSKIVDEYVSRTGSDDIVACTTLFQLLDYMSISPIRLLKIDIEGHEMEVFRSFDFSCKYRPANIILEYVPSHVPGGLPFETYRDFFRERGYGLYKVTGKPLDSNNDIPENNIWLKSE